MKKKPKKSDLKVADLTDIFGTLKFKRSAQEFKDEARAGWHD